MQDAEIEKRIAISMNYIKAVYRYLSNYAHTLSFSISQLRQFETYDEESLNLFKVLIEYCIAAPESLFSSPARHETLSW